MLAARHIYKNIGSSRVLTDVSLTVEEGTATAVIGPSGAGKTSLLRALALVDPATKGEIIIGAERFLFPASSNRPYKPWPKLTVVFQQLFLWPHLSIKDNIRLPLVTIPDKSSSEFSEELIDFFNLRGCLDQLPFQTSIGQRQRAAIVRALALRPKYLLLDEVTAALDVEHVQKLRTALLSAKARGTAIVLVTHLLGFARSVADQYLFMEDGYCVEAGHMAELDSSTMERVRAFVGLA